MSEFNKLKRVVVKEELFALTGDLEKSILLNQFIYWSERIREFDRFIEEEKELSIKYGTEENEVKIEYQNGWIYKDMDELKEEVMFNCSTTTIGRKLNELRKEGWIDRRNNPTYKWDRRYQYRVNLNKLSKDLFKIGYVLQGYKVNLTELLKISNPHSEESKNQNEKSKKQNEESKKQDDGALSEITTKTTSDITFNHSFSKEKEKPKEKESERMNEDIKTDNLKEILKNSNYTAVENQYIDAIEQAIRILYYTDKPININGMRIPQHQVREDLKRLRYKDIDSAIRSFKIQSEQQEIKNVTSYLSRLIYNAIFDTDIKIDAELRYNNLI